MADSENDGRVTIMASDENCRRFVAPLLPDCEVLGIGKGEGRAARLPAQAASARVMVGFGSTPIEDAVFDALPGLSLMIAVSAGHDALDPARLAARGIALVNIGDGNSAAVADHALALALAARRRLIEADAWVREGRWERGDRGNRMQRGFSSERAGIVGIGYAGQAIARRLDGFGIATSWWGPRPHPEQPWPRADSLLALARDTSLLFVACAGGPETEGLIDAAVIDAVGPDGLIINVARGSVIDEDALIAALKEGRLGSAALDVFI